MAQSGASCECGQVVFETARYKEGETLNCTWCERKYRYLGNDKIEPLGSTEAKPSGQSGKSANARISQRNINSRGETRRETSVSARPVDSNRSGNSGRAPSSSARGKREGVPGGLTMMIVFIVGFNALAFIALFFLMPRQPTGIRLPLWGGTPIPKAAIWPELAALIAGHVFGFLAWSCYAYLVDRMSRPLRREPQDVDGKI